jgi:uncharacterized membrane protein YeiH
LIAETTTAVELETVLFWFTIVAVAFSAISGVLIAGKNHFDLFGMIVIALATALGGGSLRDMLLNKDVFWIQNQMFLIVALVAGIATFFYARRYRYSLKLFLIPDAMGLATFSIAGTMSALSSGAPWLVASFMGVITGVAGGIIRDTMCNEIPVVFKSTLYATISLFGGMVFIALIRLELDIAFAASIAGILLFLVRLAAIKWGLSLPVFNAKE